MTHITNKIILILILIGCIAPARAIHAKEIYPGERRDRLYQTDSQLNYTYKNALSIVDSEKKKELKQEQRQWIKKRNKICNTSRIQGTGKTWLNWVLKNPKKTLCVNRQSLIRTEELTRFIKNTRYPKKSTKKYPPYPDVWGKEVPYPDSRKILTLFAVPVSNGDVYFIYTKSAKLKKDILKTPCDERTKEAYFEFFGGKEHQITCGEYSAFQKVYADPERKKTHKITFKDGSQIWLRHTRIEYCYDPFEAYLKKLDKNGKVVAKKSLLYVLPKPRKAYLSTHCDLNNTDEYALGKIEAMGVGMVLLQDDTFLVYSSANFVIRLDKNFNAKYSINQSGIYLADTDKLREILARLYKKYGNENHLYIYDETMKYLKSRKRSKIPSYLLGLLQRSAA